MDSETPKAIAVLRFSAAGDALLTTPVFASLEAHWPNTRRIAVTKEAFAPLLAMHPAIDEVVSLRPKESARSLVERLRDLGVDALLDLHGKVRSQAIRMLLRPRWFAAWHKRPALDSGLVRLGLRRYHARATIVERYHQAAESLVGSALPRMPMELPQAARTAADGLGLPPGPYVVLCPGAAWATKQWPLAHFARLGAQLQLPVVVTGSAGEAPLTAELSAHIPGALDLGGKTSWPQLAAVLGNAAAVVANDSGPMHLSRALRVPTVAIFGCTDPAQFSYDGHALLYNAPDCGPCHFYGQNRCPKGHLKCLRDLTVDMAMGALEPLLTNPEPPPPPFA